MHKPRKRCLLIDLDGTLADSLGVMRKAYELFLEGHEKVPDDEEFRRLNGPPLAEVVRRLKQAHGLPGKHQQLLADYEHLIDEAYGDVKPMPGALELLAEAQEAGWTLGVVTSNSTARCGNWLKRHGLAKIIDMMVCADDVRNGKPNPEPYILALEQTGCQAEEAIAIEDSPQGAAAALAAEIETIAFQSAMNTPAQWPDEAILIESFFKMQNSLFHNDVS